MLLLRYVYSMSVAKTNLNQPHEAVCVDLGVVRIVQMMVVWAENANPVEVAVTDS